MAFTRCLVAFFLVCAAAFTVADRHKTLVSKLQKTDLMDLKTDLMELEAEETNLAEMNSQNLQDLLEEKSARELDQCQDVINKDAWDGSKGRLKPNAATNMFKKCNPNGHYSEGITSSKCKDNWTPDAPHIAQGMMLAQYVFNMKKMMDEGFEGRSGGQIQCREGEDTDEKPAEYKRAETCSSETTSGKKALCKFIQHAACYSCTSAKGCGMSTANRFNMVVTRFRDTKIDMGESLCKCLCAMQMVGCGAREEYKAKAVEYYKSDECKKDCVDVFSAFSREDRGRDQICAEIDSVEIDKAEQQPERSAPQPPCPCPPDQCGGVAEDAGCKPNPCGPECNSDQTCKDNQCVGPGIEDPRPIIEDPEPIIGYPGAEFLDEDSKKCMVGFSQPCNHNTALLKGSPNNMEFGCVNEVYGPMEMSNMEQAIKQGRMLNSQHYMSMTGLKDAIEQKVCQEVGKADEATSGLKKHLEDCACLLVKGGGMGPTAHKIYCCSGSQFEKHYGSTTASGKWVKGGSFLKEWKSTCADSTPEVPILSGPIKV